MSTGCRAAAPEKPTSHAKNHQSVARALNRMMTSRSALSLPVAGHGRAWPGTPG
jgi:hypothetical protein